MTTKFFQPRTPVTKNNVRYVGSFPINLPAGKIDMYKWITEMTDEDYRAYATAHQGMGSYFKDGKFYSSNVENIGNETIVQLYELKYHTPSHVQFYSPRSVAYIMRWFPATVGVPWEMKIIPVSETRSELVCLIGADFPTRLLQIAAWINGLGGLFLKRHLKQEGLAFAKDIEEKFKAA